MPKFHVKTRMTVEADDLAGAADLVANHLNAVAKMHRQGEAVDGVNIPDPRWPDGMCFVTTMPVEPPAEQPA